MGKKQKRVKFNGCNEDCLNCPYPDCLKPARLMRSARELEISIGDASTESSSRMYTLELGGYGGAKPNVSRNYYR